MTPTTNTTASRRTIRHIHFFRVHVIVPHAVIPTFSVGPTLVSENCSKIKLGHLKNHYSAGPNIPVLPEDVVNVIWLSGSDSSILRLRDTNPVLSCETEDILTIFSFCQVLDQQSNRQKLSKARTADDVGQRCQLPFLWLEASTFHI